MFDPDSLSQEQINDLQRAAELAWGEDSRHPAFRGHPDLSQGQCFVTSRWVQSRLGGFVGAKKGHYFWVSPDKQYILDLTGDKFSRPPLEDGQVDENGEPIVLEPHHKRWAFGPSVYTRANNPIYRDFRIIDDNSHERANLFSKRADAYMRGGIPKQADLMGPTAYPGSTPQAQEDWINNGPMIHDEMSMSDPDQEYQFIIANNQLHVSPVHDHEELLGHAGISSQGSGPITVGYARVADGRVTWHVTSNMALTGVHQMLQEFSDNMGWGFDGMLDSKGEPIDDEFGAKKSMWYKTRDDGHLVLSSNPLPHGRKIDIIGKTASAIEEVGPARTALKEWAEDFGYILKWNNQNILSASEKYPSVSIGETSTIYSNNIVQKSAEKSIGQNSLQNLEDGEAFWDWNQDQNLIPEKLHFTSDGCKIISNGVSEQPNKQNGLTEISTQPIKLFTDNEQNSEIYSFWQGDGVKSTNLEARIGMAISPDILKSWMAINGPYMYHAFRPETDINNVKENGILPWNNSNNTTPSVYENSPLEPRPDHVYMSQPGVPPFHEQDLKDNNIRRHSLMAQIDLRKLNYQNINPDEDSWIDPREDYRDKINYDDGNYPSWGAWAEGEDKSHPIQSQFSLENHGSLAHRGSIPPEAFDLVPYGQFHSDSKSFVKPEPFKWSSYPGGGNILDKMKNMPHLDQHNLGDQDAEPDTELGDITKAQNLTCGDCEEKFNTINELILHDKDVHNPDVDPVEEDNFPWGPGFNQDSQNPGFGTQPIPESAWSGSGGM